CLFHGLTPFVHPPQRREERSRTPSVLIIPLVAKPQTEVDDAWAISSGRSGIIGPPLPDCGPARPSSGPKSLVSFLCSPFPPCRSRRTNGMFRQANERSRPPPSHRPRPLLRGHRPPAPPPPPHRPQLRRH